MTTHTFHTSTPWGGSGVKRVWDYEPAHGSGYCAMADSCDDRSNIVKADFLNRILTDFSGDTVSRDSVTTTITRPRVLSRELAKGGWLGFDSRHKQKLLPFDTTSSLASYSTGTGISPRHFDSSPTIAFSPPSRTKLNPLRPNDSYKGRTAPLTSKRCILYIYSTNIDTEYFKHDIYSPSFSLQNAVCFIILTYLVPVLFTFYIQGVLK